MTDLTNYLKGVFKTPILWAFDPNKSLLGFRLAYWGSIVLVLALGIMVVKCTPLIPVILLTFAFVTINYGRQKGQRKLWFVRLQKRVVDPNDAGLDHIDFRRSEVDRHTT